LRRPALGLAQREIGERLAHFALGRVRPDDARELLAELLRRCGRYHAARRQHVAAADARGLALLLRLPRHHRETDEEQTVRRERPERAEDDAARAGVAVPGLKVQRRAEDSRLLEQRQEQRYRP